MMFFVYKKTTFLLYKNIISLVQDEHSMPVQKQILFLLYKKYVLVQEDKFPPVQKHMCFVSLQNTWLHLLGSQKTAPSDGMTVWFLCGKQYEQYVK